MNLFAPNLELLASDPWSHQPDDILVDLLKLSAWLFWPGEKFEQQRKHFLARNAIDLVDRYEDRKKKIQSAKKSGPKFKKIRLNITESRLRDLREELLIPVGGSGFAAHMSDRNLTEALDTRAKHMRTVASVVEFILRYDLHLQNDRRGASVNKAVAFIMDGGYIDRDLLKKRPDIIGAWSAYKSVSHICFSNFIIESPFSKFDIGSKDPLKFVDDFWWNNEKHHVFFRLARYAEKFLTTFEPFSVKGPLIKKSDIPSVENFVDFPEDTQFLPPFTEAERVLIARAKAHDVQSEKTPRPVP